MSGPTRRTRSIVTLLGCALAAAAVMLPARAQQKESGDWPAYGRDPGAQRFSPLTQITPDNVRTLTRAWTFDTGATAMQVTPLVIDGVMYVAAGTHIFALEPETSKVLWKFPYEGLSRRGLAYWPGDGTAGPRFYSGAADGRMIAVDVKTGTLAKEFGAGGVVDLKASISVDGGEGSFGLPSPPAVYRNVVITGGTNGENAPGTGRLYGDIRGWDARTGKMLWAFHTVPRPGEPGYETWPPGAYKNRSGTNAWGFMTVDVARGIVYAPIGSPTADFYGADRHGNNLYGNSLVALDALTGKLKWHQQLVHHDLWDYDPAAPPALIDVRQGGRVIPSVAQITKMGLLFIFDRVTGKPVFGVEELPVPQTDVPGEWTAKTQPFPMKPVPLSRMTFDPAKDFYTLTPEHATWCKNLWEQNGLTAAGPYAPMPLGRDVVTFPSTLGGGGFGGVSYNPQLGLVFVNVSNLGMVGRMEPRTDPKTGEVTYVKNSVTGGPYGRFWNPDNRIPCSAPPFGELVAVDANTGDIAWRVPLGLVEELEAKGIRNTGSLTLGGSMATASGLVFIGATADKRFRAFDAKTGKELWVAELDADAKAAPMTFLGRDGRQYVVIMAGGGHQLSRSSPASGSNLIAFALPPKAANGSTQEAKPEAAPWARRELRAGIIGTDTSHVPAFAKTLKSRPEWKIKLVAAFKGGSPDLPTSANRVEGFARTIREEYGVELVDTIDALLEKVDVVLLTSVDGRPHLAQVTPVLNARKPVFVDKPLAASLEDARRIVELAKKTGTPFFSSSSSRFHSDIPRLRDSPGIGKVSRVQATYTLNTIEFHPDLFFYGIHGVEALYAVMGTGCTRLTRRIEGDADVTTCTWNDGRVGVFHGTLKGAPRGPLIRMSGEKGTTEASGAGGYEGLLRVIAEFFHTGRPPVDVAETIEIFEFMTAAQLSKERGGAEVSLAELRQ